MKRQMRLIWATVIVLAFSATIATAGYIHIYSDTLIEEGDFYDDYLIIHGDGTTLQMTGGYVKVFQSNDSSTLRSQFRSAR